LTTEHQETLNKAASDILIYVDNIFIIQSIYNAIGNNYILGIASPYLNFRDALFHYRKMYEAAEKGDTAFVLQQTACIDEHLNRGIRDFAINLCSNYFIRIIHKMMADKALYVTNEIFQRLRHIYHELKNIVAEIRLGGQQLLRFDNNNVYWLQRMINAIEDFDSLIGENPLIYRLYERIRSEPLNIVKK